MNTMIMRLDLSFIYNSGPRCNVADSVIFKVLLRRPSLLCYNKNSSAIRRIKNRKQKDREHLISIDRSMDKQSVGKNIKI